MFFFYDINKMVKKNNKEALLTYLALGGDLSDSDGDFDGGAFSDSASSSDSEGDDEV